jgi:hypothetical protein
MFVGTADVCFLWRGSKSMRIIILRKPYSDKCVLRMQTLAAISVTVVLRGKRTKRVRAVV